MRNWIIRLLSPPRFPDDAEKDRVANLLNIILLAMMAVFAVNTIIAFFFNPALNATVINGVTVIITLGLLLTLRRRRVTTAAWATVFVFWIMVMGVTFFISGLSIITITSFFVLVVLAGVIAGNSAAILILALNLITGAIVFALEQGGQLAPALPGTPLINVTSSAGNMVILTLLIGLTLRALNKTLAEAHAANQALQNAQIQLETRVAERTRDLALAAEVGHSLAQVRDLDTLLQDASELIRERFGLYHVQIYLTDSRKQILVLHAGTGLAAKELLNRRHSLAITPDSINGRAALNKQPITVADTRKSNIFRLNPLLPDTRSEMAIPLLLGDRVLGVLDLQSTEVGSLKEESLPAFKTIASQLAISIDNAELFAVASQSREEVEAYLQRLTQEGWSDYLDAISREEKLVYVFDAEDSSAKSATAITPISADRNVLQHPIALANEPIGVIQVEADDGRYWTEEALSLVANVSQQVAQQLENLRLLDEAQRYQSQAEALVRRITQEAWREQLQRQQSLQTGFVYDRTVIHSLDAQAENSGDPPPAAILPLQIHGETVGSIELVGEITPETNELAQVVSERLAGHIENLRLSEQTELALAESKRRSTELAVINEIAYIAAAQLETKSLLEKILTQLKQVLAVEALMVSRYDPVRNQSRIVFSYDQNLGVEMNLPPVPLEPHHLTYQIIHSKQPKLILYSAAEVEEQRQNPPPNMLSDKHTVMASLMFVPMMRGDEAIGVLSVQSYTINAYSENDLNLINGLASYVSTALQNAELFAEIQRQGEKERVINTVSQRIQSTLSVEEALKTAVAELGKALKASRTQAELLPMKQATPGNGRAS